MIRLVKTLIVRLSLRTTCFGCSLLSLVGSILVSFSVNLYMLSGSLALMGTGLGVYYIRAKSIVAQSFDASKRSLGISIGVTGTALGAAILPIIYKFLMDRFTIKQVSLIISGIVSHLFIAAVLITNPKAGNKPIRSQSLGLESIRKVYNAPVVIYQLGLFLLLSGKRSQFPFFIPFAESIGLVGYEPAMILTIMSIADLIFRPIGGAISGTKFVRKYGQSLFVATFVGAIGMMNILARVQTLFYI